MFRSLSRWTTVGAVGLLLLGGAISACAEEADSAAADTSRGEHRLRKITLDLADDDTSLAKVTIDLDNEMIRKSSDRVRFGESIRVSKDERVAGDVVSIGGSVVVEGEVLGDAVTVGGRVEIAPGARVAGSVVGVGGNVSIGDSAVVNGDAVSVWGSMDVAPSAVVSGEEVLVGGLGFTPKIGGPFWIGKHTPGHDMWSLVRRLVWVLVLTGLSLLAFSLFPSRMRRISHTVESRGFVAFLAGFAGLILWLPAFVLLCVTIIGIPVALLLVFLTPVAMLFGYAGVAEVAGRRILRGRSLSAPSMVATLAVGIVGLEGILLVARVLRTFGSIFDLVGWILGVIGWSVITIAVTMGFGAFLMTRFRAERAPAPAGPGSERTPAGAPPPAGF